MNSFNPLSTVMQLLLQPIKNPFVSDSSVRARRRNNKLRQKAKRYRGRQPIPESCEEKFIMEGDLMAGVNTQFAVSGQDIVVNNDTWVFGELKVGRKVIVQGILRDGIERFARKIVLKD